MTDNYAELRAAAEKLPRVKWTKTRSTVCIPETEDAAGKDLPINGLDKQYARHLATYIAAANPETIRSLLAERDAIASEVETLRSHNALLRASIAQVEAENDRLREALDQLRQDAARWMAQHQETGDAD